jgi:hypothetical protein
VSAPTLGRLGPYPLVVDDAAPCTQSPPTPWRDFARALAAPPRRAHILYGQKTLVKLCSCIGRASSSSSPPVRRVDNRLEEGVLVRASLDVGGVQLLDVGVEVVDTADAGNRGLLPNIPLQLKG